MGKAVFIYASARKRDSWTLGKLFEEIIREDYEIESVNLFGMDIKPCTGCDSCKKIKRCVIYDDVTNLYKKLIECDLLVICSPIYFNALPGTLKNLIDRMQLFFNNGGAFEKKSSVAVELYSAGSPPSDGVQFKASKLITDLFYLSIGKKDLGGIGITNTDEIPVSKRDGINEYLIKLKENIEIEKFEFIEI